MHDQRTHRARLVLLLAVACGFIAAAPSPALAAPAPTFLYSKPGTNSCGELWHGDEFTDYKPLDPAFVPLHTVPPTDKARCAAGLALLDPTELAQRLGSKPDVPDQTQNPCGALQRALEGGLPLQGKYRSVCEALGYTYIGKVPANAINIGPPQAPSAGDTDDGGCAVAARGWMRPVGSSWLIGLLIAVFFGA